MTVSIPIWGKLGDLFGLKKIFIIGYGIFIVSSLLCSLSPSIMILVINRGLQGLGGGMLLATGPAFIVKYIPKDVRGAAFGIQATSSALGLVVGAPLGGVLTEYLSWHAIFFINVPIGLFAAILGFFVLPNDRKLKKSSENNKEKIDFDFVGAILLIVGLILFIVGMNNGSKEGWHMFPLLELGGGSFTLLLLFVYESRITSPLLPIETFKNRTFFYGMFANIAFFMVLSGNNFIMPFQITKMLNISSSKVGFVLFAFSLTYALSSIIMGKLSDIINPAYLCISGAVTALLSCWLFATLIPEKSLTVTILFLVSLGLSFSAFIAPANKMVMASVSPKNAGSASSLYRTGMTLSSLIGVSFFDAVLSVDSTITTHSFQRIYYIAVIPILIATLLLSALIITSRKKRSSINKTIWKQS